MRVRPLFVLSFALLVAGTGLISLLLAYGPGRSFCEVVKGDTLTRLARKHGVTVSDLREWNEVEGDRIEVGQRLWLSPSSSLRERLLFGWEALWPPAAVAVLPPPGPSLPTPSRRVRGIKMHAPTPPPIPRGDPTEDPPMGTTTSLPPSPLVMPPPQPCREITSEGGGEMSVERSPGLSEEQVQGAVNGFQRAVSRCFSGHSQVQGRLTLEFAVGCDGRVKTVEILEDTVGDRPFGECVIEVYRYAPFPSHGRDEVAFQLPLIFEPAPPSQ